MTARSVKRPKSYFFIVKQEKDENLKDYITRFNNKALHVESWNDELMLSTMMAGLKLSKLLWSLKKNNPKNFQKLMNRVQKYANTKALIDSRRSERSSMQTGGKRKKG